MISIAYPLILLSGMIEDDAQRALCGATSLIEGIRRLLSHSCTFTKNIGYGRGFVCSQRNGSMLENVDKPFLDNLIRRKAFSCWLRHMRCRIFMLVNEVIATVRVHVHKTSYLG